MYEIETEDVFQDMWDICKGTLRPCRLIPGKWLSRQCKRESVGKNETQG